MSTAPDATAPAISRPRTGALIITLTCVGAFAGQVDASIVQLALPTFEKVFGAPLNAVGWVAIAYSLSFAAALPVFARLSEIAGRRGLYIAGFLLFGGFSTACGFAPTLALLIGFRVLQGVSGALLGANSVVILVSAAGPARRARAMGIYAGAQAVGICAGPLAGGALLARLDWHWIFWVTAPVAALCAGLGWRVLPRGAPSAGPRAFDWPGALLLIPALAGMMLAISKLNAWGAASPAVLGTTSVSLALLAAFVWHERQRTAPLLQLRLFRASAFSAGCAAILLSYAMLYGIFFTISFALVRGYHATPFGAGLRLAVVPAALGLVAPWSGSLAVRRPRLTMLAGIGLALAALGLLHAALAGGDGVAALTPGLALYGLGLGLFVAPNNTATLEAAPAAYAGQAGGLLNLTRAFGTAFGVATASALLAWRLEQLTGLHETTMAAREAALRTSAGAVMLLLAAYAGLAGAACLVRRRQSNTSQTGTGLAGEVACKTRT